MIKVLLVDDEPIARIKLRCLIDWEKEGYMICGEADNGLDALKKAQELNPDVIFTDMNMGGMNGVDFIKSVRDVAPSAQIIAFSAFDDFEYVRQSLKEGALDYLVKHKIDEEALLTILSAIKERIDKAILEKKKISRIMEMASSGKILIQRNVIMNILNGYIQEDFRNVMREYEISLDEKNLVVAAARIDSYYQLKDRLTAQEFAAFQETIENVISNVCQELDKTVFVGIDEGRFAFIMSFAGISSEAHISSRSKENICAINGTVKRFMNVTMSFGISSVCPSFTKIREHYTEACAALENGYYKGSSYVVDKNELNRECSFENSIGLSAMDEKNIISCIRSLKREETLRQLEDMFKSIKERKASYNSVKVISVELINILEKMVKELGIAKGSIYPNMNLYEEIMKFRTIDEMSIWFKDLYGSIMDALEKNQSGGKHSPAVKKAIEYILKNYHKDISLSDVSQYIDVSPQYLSKLFKEECGKRFVAYLNGIRIEQAKKMLAEGIKLKDLADKTGFNNYTYFFTVFKEITGMTPQQYEKTIMKGEDLGTVLK